MAKKTNLKSFLANSIFLSVVLAFGVQQAGAREVPLGDANSIDDSFDGATSVYAADIDGDGDMDVLGAAEIGSDISWWENTSGDGTSWARYDVNDSFVAVQSVYAADIDGDGDMDVLGAAFIDGDITWWENTGGGFSWTRHDVNDNFAWAYSVYAADIDGDGDMDVLGASADLDNGCISWWENTAGNGTSWARHDVNDNFDGAYSVHAADIDGDGDMDVLGAANGDSCITWWQNTNSSGTAWTRHDVNDNFGGAASVYASDIDGDGDMDVLGAANFDDDITWWENTDSNGTTWSRHDVNDNFDGAYSVYASDIDGDGDMDVLGAADGDGCITWWENTLDLGTNWIRHDVSDNFGGARSIYAADIDGDGKLDVLGAAREDDDITWWENKSIQRRATFCAKNDVDIHFDGVYSVHAADIDGDGDMDVLGAADKEYEISWWENTLDLGTNWSRHDINDYFWYAKSVYAADIDGDGDMDVLGAGADCITWWENTNSSGTNWTRHDVNDNFGRAYSVYSADIDGDGDMDVLGAANFDDDITWWENTAGDGTNWTRHDVNDNFVWARSVYSADIDDDGDMDVLGAADYDDDITWWENTAGDGTNWTRHDVDGHCGGAISVYATDIDGDGDMDVLGAAYDEDDITWWENNFVIPGDFEPDEDVDFADLGVVARNWLNTGCGPCDCDEVDLTCDGDVDFLDFGYFANYWLAGK